MPESKLPCYYAHGGVNFKNGFATTCPISSAHLVELGNFGGVPSEFLNSKGFREYRLKLDRGEWPEHCHLCQTAEKEGTKSMRHDYKADLTNYNFETGEIDFSNLKHVEMRFSNSCNMACLHCSEVYSSQWGSRLKNYVPDQDDWDYNLEQLLQTQHREGPDDKKQIRLSKADALQIADDLINNFPNVEKIDFAGGEVLYQKQFFPVLERLAQHPNAKNMYIFFHSNFNAPFKVDVLNDLLKPFGSSKIKISVDAGTNIYSYFRDGDWDVLKENLSKFKAINKTTFLDTVCTTSIYQILDIKNILLSLCDLDVNEVSLSTVFTPRYINPAVAYRMFGNSIFSDIHDTIDALHRLKRKRRLEPNRDKYRSWRERSEDFADIEGCFKDLEHIKTYLLNHETTEHDAEAFVVYANKMDKLWKQQFNQFFKKYTLTPNSLLRNNNIDYNEMYPYNKTDIDKDIETEIRLSNSKGDMLRQWYQKLIAMPMPEDVKDWEDKELKDKAEEISQILKKVRPEMGPESKAKIDEKLDMLDVLKTRPDYTAWKRYDNYLAQSRYAVMNIEETFHKEKLKQELGLKLAIHNAGFKQFTHDGLNIPFNPDWKRIAVNVSGGADSCLLTYLLCKHIHENNIDCKIDVITHSRVWTIRPWAGPVSVNVYNALKEKWPNIIGERLVNYVPPELEHSTLGNIVNDRSGDQIIVQSYNDFAAAQNNYSAIFNATTKNPSMDVPAEDRMLNRDHNAFGFDEFACIYNNYWQCMPFIATEKDWVVKQYKDLGILDLYTTTRSCEGDGRHGGPLLGKDYWWFKYNADEPVETCGKCFWCVERKWAEDQNEF
tara:strand:+ start:9622 stop:12114 length:2493 start_codon:yes stop_codon:yes gene_type:complete